MGIQCIMYIVSLSGQPVESEIYLYAYMDIDFCLYSGRQLLNIKRGVDNVEEIYYSGTVDFDRTIRDLEIILKESRVEGIQDVIVSIKRIFETLWKKGLKGRAPDLGRYMENGSTFISAIPSTVEGYNSDRLLVLCLDRDNFHDRLREMVYHSGIYCRGINRMAVFLTSKWDNQTYKLHEKAIDLLKKNGIKFIFALITENGASSIRI